MGPIQIPTNYHFFAILSNETLAITTARQDNFTKIQEIIDMNTIKPNHFVSKDDQTYQQDFLSNTEEGVQDLKGEFSEGYCFKINTKEEKSFIICFDK